ncbi:tRNA (guanosine(46)-N7)-methyltransferase TrmB [Alicyclobacillus dauci]|uniref:tRNA (guanine-N(7)-)-methyltransferase n=1 Tax=Alicyclobacillus dauci TaxID=1475485 RepID=A0ABY6YZK5_9BACL|nr:tRNA (guanosine(46)-N7)-methyltransferase TrmB [Alicyclobacillus dauci]WAH36016.1 tRNA (guanosine(46)-N7)-methyltransferase TrmB [Alicyclobacillus dauci]
MRYRGAHHLPEWLEQGKPVLKNNNTDDIREALASIKLPVCIEVGCGKGGFIHQMAQARPDIFFIGVDKVMTVIAKAAANAVEIGLANVLFIIGDVEDIAEKMTPNSVERLFLNFSDPWPKSRHEPRRLTDKSKLAIYERLLTERGVVEQKTDNLPFFEWSVASFESAGWHLERVLRGFAEGEPEHSQLSSQYVQTEYEQKFRHQGIPINYLRARPPV